MEFPPGKGALGPTGAGADVGDVSHITWRRPADFFPPAEGSALSYDVFVGGVEPNDIRQGQLADCWSVDSSVTMSAVSPRPLLLSCDDACALSWCAALWSLIVLLLRSSCRTCALRDRRVGRDRCRSSLMR